jgi:hypothetical protein
MLMADTEVDSRVRDLPVIHTVHSDLIAVGRYGR